MISKALVVGAYQKKLEEIAAAGDINLTVVVPPAWGQTRLETVHTRGYQLVVTGAAFNGNFHLHYYPRLKKIVAAAAADVIHIDEEPYNLATFHAMRLAKRVNAKTVVFTWQNLKRKYPPPFSWMERYVLKHADALIAGNAEARRVWQAKGYAGPVRQIPQFGVDPAMFYRRRRIHRVSKPSVALRRSARRPSQPSMTLGYVGRLVEEKGVEILLRAASKLSGPWNMQIIGRGPERQRFERMAQWLGIQSRVTFDRQLPSTHMPNYLSGLDVLVLPSLSRPNWKEQFGRVLIEAMACEVVTVGARSGAIPEVIGRAGLLFEEGNVDALRQQLQRLLDDVSLRESLRQAGQQRVLNHYTHAAIAQHTVALYRQLAEGNLQDAPVEPQPA
ncbi:MAG: glycosyltransferase [Anaerolineae bacterium]